MPHLFSKLYDRKSWPHWVDSDGDCQNTRHELLNATSQSPVSFKDHRRCIVLGGSWFDVYTGIRFTQASDLDVDHVVPLSYAHSHGAAEWTKDQKRAFANDPDNLLVVDDSTNRAKSDMGPHEWMPPRRKYWCEYINKWMAIKDKYVLTYDTLESEVLSQLEFQCIN